MNRIIDEFIHINWSRVFLTVITGAPIIALLIALSV